MEGIFGELLKPADTEPIPLRAHQEEAVAAIVRSLTPRPGTVAPAGLRATVQMATGTGKSYVGAAAAQRLAPRGVVLVVVPTLDLLVQMVGSWRVAGRRGEMAAVCSLVDDELPHGVPGTTSPLQIGRWISRAAAKRLPLTLFSTYASAGAVADAYALWAKMQGELLPELDLMVCDEAHRSSGSAEKSWTVVHHQSEIPSARRLYMTATPRIWLPPKNRQQADDRRIVASGVEGPAEDTLEDGEVNGSGDLDGSGDGDVDGGGGERRKAYQPLPQELAVSMDDQRIYGPQIFTLGLAEAVEKGLVAPFEVIVLELRDPLADRNVTGRQPVPWGPGAGEEKDGSEDQVPVEHLAAIQAGLLKVCAEEGLERVITFHNRTLEARYFSETLNQTAEKLHAENPRKYPPEVWAQWLSGEHPVEFRKEVLADYGDGFEQDGLKLRVISNCLVLSEGVDMPDASVALMNGSGSMVKVVQQIGRVLRMKPDEGKVARLVVPVFLGPGEEPGDILVSNSYGPLVRILTAIRSYDARMLEALAVPQRSGKRTSGRSAEAAVSAGEGDGAGGAGAFTLPVRFQGRVDEDALALFVSTQVFRSESAYWKEGMKHCKKWFDETGSLDVPYNQMAGEQGNFALGRWVSDRRYERASGDMPDYRVLLLGMVGMIWSVSDAKFETGLAWARQWAAEHGGSLAAPARASVQGYPIGAWLAGLRAQADVPDGEKGALGAERRAALKAIDPWWAPAWPITWQRAYAAARTWWLESDGQVDWAALPVKTVFEGEQLGRWTVAQRAGWSDLAEEQRELLAALGIDQDPELVAAATAKAARAAKAGPRTSQADRFALGITALAQFVAREGHAKPKRQHKERLEQVMAGADSEDVVEQVEVGLGAWLNNTKSRRAGLSAGQLAQLAEHGVEWAVAGV
ncbi:Helicase associated domain protein [Kitasatospora sp. NPDC090308]|uniref:DEAD/DEAH box helicase n=1 Tax=Kitasatospora sp. NPDC090308 TaxID=3364082 RepID=UPI00382E43CD